MSEDFVDDDRCFVCGKKNPLGLKLEFKLDRAAGSASTEVRFPGHFQGWHGVVHGGLLAAVLDEVMIYAAGAFGVTCVTGEITVRYSKPLGTESPIRFEGRVVGRKGRVVTTEAEAVDASGRKAAWATAKLVVIEDRPPARKTAPEAGS